MRKEDITALFDNLLSNAYEAAEKSTERYIILTVLREDEDAMLIKLANSCDTPPAKNADGKYTTTKDASLGHGVGLNSIMNCVDRYSGQISMVYNHEEKTFTTVIIMKKTRREEKKHRK